MSIKKLASSVLFSLQHAGDQDGSDATERLFKKDEEEALRIAHEAMHALQEKNKEVVSSVEIRDAVLQVLKKDEMPHVSAAYELSSLHFKDMPIKEVLKWNGEKEPFHPYKLFKSIRKACTRCGIVGGKIAEQITHEVVKELARSQKNGVVTTRII
ncbi:hypothetical protein HY419_01190, partial [candidate division WWE3 bacterium]|nr:hypothetical protein [candidate division WWE3 bacterium]